MLRALIIRGTWGRFVQRFCDMRRADEGGMIVMVACYLAYLSLSRAYFFNEILLSC